MSYNLNQIRGGQNSSDDEQQSHSPATIQVTGETNIKRYRKEIVEEDSDCDEWDLEEAKMSDDDDPKEDIEEKQSVWDKIAEQVHSFGSVSPVPKEDEEEEEEEEKEDDQENEIIEERYMINEEDCQPSSSEDHDKDKTFKDKVEEIRKLFDDKKATATHQQQISEAEEDLERATARRQSVKNELEFFQDLRQILRDFKTNAGEDLSSLENMNSLIKNCHKYKTNKMKKSPGEVADEIAESISDTDYEAMKDALKLEMEKIRSNFKRSRDVEEGAETDDGNFFENLSKKVKIQPSNEGIYDMSA